MNNKNDITKQLIFGIVLIVSGLVIALAIALAAKLF